MPQRVFASQPEVIAQPSAPDDSLAFEAGAYRVQLADSPALIDAALQLRFAVFNLELGEGLAESYMSGRDQDRFDRLCDHLVVLERATQRVVGTYRLQSYATASAGEGFYAAGEFDLAVLPTTMLQQAVEIGRACIAQEHRNSHVLYLLWKGLLTYVRLHQGRYLFGCCSLTSQNPQEGLAAFALLQQQGAMHSAWCVPPHPAFVCHPEQGSAVALDALRIPKLFRSYLRYGAQVCSQPALDRAFKTIDFLVVFDSAGMSAALRSFFLDR
jgi:putative hemolysin